MDDNARSFCALTCCKSGPDWCRNRNCHETILLNQTRPGEKSPGLFVAPGGCGLDGNLARGLSFLDGVKNFGSRPPAEPAELHRFRHEVRAYPPPECRLGTAKDFAALISGEQRVSDNSFGDYGISRFASHRFSPLEFDSYRYGSDGCRVLLHKSSTISRARNRTQAHSQMRLPLSAGQCCKSRFAEGLKISEGRRRVFRVEI